LGAGSDNFGDLSNGQEWKTDAQFGGIQMNADTGGFGSIGGSGLHGSLYDFKQNRNRENNFAYTRGKRGKTSLFVDNLNKIHQANFSPESLEPYFRAPQELTLTHLAISPRPAAEGPRYFGAEQDVKPKGWIAHYQGTLIVPEDGRYRLCGMADDYLSVFLDNEPWLYACWPEVQQELKTTNWQRSDDSNRWLSPIGGHHLIFGPWKRLKKGQHIKVDLGLGERPGGKLAFTLMVQQQGKRYKREKHTKRPILPIFTTAPFSSEQRRKITSSFPNYPFNWTNTLIFRPAE